jgi:hypothetical protein
MGNRSRKDDGDDESPAEEWLRQLNATCNRLSTQYLQLLRAAASDDEQGGSGGGGAGDHGGRSGSAATTTSVVGSHHHDPRWSSSSHSMRSLQDPPPPPLAASVASSLLQCQLAAENISVAASSVLTLIRTLRLSLLLTDSDTMMAEQELERQDCRERTRRALEQAGELEQTLMELRRELMSSSSQPEGWQQ